MGRRLRALVVAALLPVALAAVTLGASPVDAAPAPNRVMGFGANPTNLNMYVYAPQRLAAKPALLVLVHSCQESATGVFVGAGREFVAGADTYGYVILLPESTRRGNCFDVSRSATRSRDSGDSTGIMSMVSYVKQRYDIDPDRVAIAGFSTGATTTNVLAAGHPEVFSAHAALDQDRHSLPSGPASDAIPFLGLDGR